MFRNLQNPSALHLASFPGSPGTPLQLQYSRSRAWEPGNEARVHQRALHMHPLHSLTFPPPRKKILYETLIRPLTWIPIQIKIHVRVRLSRNQLPLNQLPIDQLPIDQLPTGPTPIKSTSHELNCNIVAYF